MVLDEVQMVPELFRPLKVIVDENRQLPDGGKGRFLLTSSASVMALPKLSDALVGRMALHNLATFSVCEIKKASRKSFIDSAFSTVWKFEQLQKSDVSELIMQATYPELLPLDKESLRYEWCNGYINTILQRDVRMLLEVEKIAFLPDMLRLLAARTGGLLNEAALSRDIELNHMTTKRYRLLLESLFLTLTIPAWSVNLGKRLIKAPKLYMNDLNLWAYLHNTDLSTLHQRNPILFGQVLENFVAIELSKQTTFSSIRVNLYHYRTTSGQEVDFILEGPENSIIAVEVKSKSKVSARDFRHIEALKLSLKDKFRRGFVLYQGTEVIPFGEDMWAVPVSAV